MCGTLGNPKYDGYCTHCFSNLFPGDARTAAIRTKSKETKWVNAILETDTAHGYEWICDKTIYVKYAGGCCESKRRIDLRTMIGSRTLAIEIDENQHKYYAVDYEATRYNNLMMDFTAPYVFLRINPDSFRKNGIKQNPRFEERLAQVEAKILEILSSIGSVVELMTVIHLFYDE